MLILSLSLSAVSCRTAADREREERERLPQKLSLDEQNKRAMDTFQNIFSLLEDSERKAVLPRLEQMYKEIIDNYPDAALSQESYWRLILIYLEDYNPPLFDKIEVLYAGFTLSYPQSQFRNEVEDMIATSYARHAKWQDLIKFSTPVVKQYIDTGKLARPQLMFAYADAKMNLGDIDEAEKGYRIVIALFPLSRESDMAKYRLEALKRIKYKQ